MTLPDRPEKDVQAPIRDMPRGPIADVIVDSPLWASAAGAEAMVCHAVAEAAATVSTSGGELAILLTGDSTIRALNRDWRGIDQATNVLSFPAHARDSVARNGREEAKPPVMLGDIVIAYETAAREALAEDKAFLHHLAHLTVHGFLHLVGYDHEVDAEADAMEALEVEILARLGIADPYRARGAVEI